jgi:hypothetical protein
MCYAESARSALPRRSTGSGVSISDAIRERRVRDAAPRLSRMLGQHRQRGDPGRLLQPAQLANALAVRLDREERAEMSCIVGVGGNVKPLVRTATSGRPICTASRITASPPR